MVWGEKWEVGGGEEVGVGRLEEVEIFSYPYTS